MRISAARVDISLGRAVRNDRWAVLESMSTPTLHTTVGFLRCITFRSMDGESGDEYAAAWGQALKAMSLSGGDTTQHFEYASAAYSNKRSFHQWRNGAKEG
eukprot:3351945-Amphidinium_carterae.1